MRRNRPGLARPSQNDHESEDEDHQHHGPEEAMVCAAPTQQGPLFYALLTLSPDSGSEFDGLPQEIALHASSHTIGRTSNANDKDHLQINRPYISAMHAKIEVHEGDGGKNPVIRLHDLSSNGTYVNGTLVGKHKFTVLKVRTAGGRR